MRTKGLKWNPGGKAGELKRLRAALRNGDLQSRRLAARQLRKSPIGSAAPELHAALNDTDLHVRRDASFAISKLLKHYIREYEGAIKRLEKFIFKRTRELCQAQNRIKELEARFGCTRELKKETTRKLRVLKRYRHAFKNRKYWSKFLGLGIAELQKLEHRLDSGAPNIGLSRPHSRPSQMGSGGSSYRWADLNQNGIEEALTLPLCLL